MNGVIRFRPCGYDARRSVAAVGLALCVSLADSSLAQEQPDAERKASQRRENRTSDAKLREFDFWVGRWNVVNRGGVAVGTNDIQKLLNGYLILENWVSAKGRAGKSMNFYNRRTDKWRQIWIDDGGGLIDVEGAFTDGAMRFAGRHAYPDGHVEKYRMTFTPKRDGSVHQFIEHSKDGAKTWYVWFDGTYVRADEKFEPAKRVAVERSADADRRAFDFRVGHWDAVGSQGGAMGVHRIESSLAGFLILENWTGRGGDGMSFNYLDPSDRRWKQNGVSDSGGLTCYEGGFKDGAMRMTGWNLQPGNQQVDARVVLTPNSAGSIHQFIERSKDGGKEWTVYFDGTFRAHPE